MSTSESAHRSTPAPPSSPNRVAVISGGSSGIGRAFVAKLYSDGWRIFTCGRHAEKLRRLEADFPGIRGFVCDVTDRAAVTAMARDVAAETDRIDLLISNAGGLTEIDFTRDDIANRDVTSDIRNNLEGAINWIAAFMPALKKAERGRLVVIGSGYGVAPATRAPIYSAAKAGIHSLAKSLRRQLAPLGIAVTEVLPPVVDTPAVAHRNVKKVPVEAAVAQALRAIERRQAECYIGPARFLPVLLRLAPGFMEAMVAKT
jgi:uncharacterized oxidoreductase